MKIEIINQKDYTTIFLDDFVYAQASGNYVDVYVSTREKPYVFRMLLKELHALIEEQGNYYEHHILRLGRSWLVNKDYFVTCNTIKATITLRHPKIGDQVLSMKRTEVKEMFNQLEKDKRLEILRSVPGRFKLTVPVLEINSKPEPYVDLGLPSGTLWGACNLGAARPELEGNYYTWEERQHLNLPTRTQFQELVENCVWLFCYTEGCSGFLVQGLNANVIFLPCAGYRKGEEFLRDVNVRGKYWTSESIDDDIAYSFCFEEIESEQASVEGLDAKELRYSIRMVK